MVICLAFIYASHRNVGRRTPFVKKTVKQLTASFEIHTKAET